MVDEDLRELVDGLWFVDVKVENIPQRITQGI